MSISVDTALELSPHGEILRKYGTCFILYHIHFKVLNFGQMTEIFTVAQWVQRTSGSHTDVVKCITTPESITSVFLYRCKLALIPEEESRRDHIELTKNHILHPVAIECLKEGTERPSAGESAR